ncbi:hypothetical protein DFH09DRAFT_1100571 [Mycena vulgaris]|nr:hypothetical protein DFH09DRAFT_1100571 [Mycena vulgaris]
MACALTAGGELDDKIGAAGRTGVFRIERRRHRSRGIRRGGEKEVDQIWTRRTWGSLNSNPFWIPKLTQTDPLSTWGGNAVIVSGVSKVGKNPNDFRFELKWALYHWKIKARVLRDFIPLVRIDDESEFKGFRRSFECIDAILALKLPSEATLVEIWESRFLSKVNPVGNYTENDMIPVHAVTVQCNVNFGCHDIDFQLP